MEKNVPRRLRVSTLLVALIATTVIQANQCSLKGAAKNLIRPVVQSILDEAVMTGWGWRLHWMEITEGYELYPSI